MGGTNRVYISERQTWKRNDRDLYKIGEQVTAYKILTDNGWGGGGQEEDGKEWGSQRWEKMGF